MNISDPITSLLRSIAAVLFLIVGGTVSMGQQYEKVLSFTDAFAEGPFSPNEGFGVTSMMEGSDGSFYGTTEALAGFNVQPTTSGPGTIFKMTSDGYLTTLHYFTGTPGTLQAIGVDDQFYGITSGGGTLGNGTIFRVSRSGSFQTVAEFTGTGGVKKGRLPVLIFQAPDRNFYGVTSAGGVSDAGTVFKLSPGGFLSTLVEFTGPGGSRPGRNPTKLFLGVDGMLWGVTETGGSSDNGTVFRLAVSGGEFETVADFTGTTGNRRGSHPISLIESAPGIVLGTTVSGGSNNVGTVFRFSTAEGWSTLLEFNGANGANPAHNLVKDTTGLVYGVTQQGGAENGGLIYRVQGSGVVETVLSFEVIPPLPGLPQSGASWTKGPLVAGRDGRLYVAIQRTGYIDSSGTSDRIIEIDSSGSRRDLAAFYYSFNESIFDGFDAGHLLVSKNGVLYGTTHRGGYVGPVQATGSIFRFGSSGFETLVGFGVPRTPDTPRKPYAGIIYGNDGNFYGTSRLGGSNNLGTIYRISPAGGLNVIHSFAGTFRTPYSSYDGAHPLAGLCLGNDGNLYGTTTSVEPTLFSPGLPCMAFGITKSGNIIWNNRYDYFATDNDIPERASSLIQASDGNLYGRGYSPYSALRCLTTSGDVSNFQGDYRQYNPQGRLLEAFQGGSTCFLGTTSSAGAYLNGSVFRTNADGQISTVASLRDIDEIAASTEWQNFNIGLRSGTFTYSYTIVPKQANMDGVTGLSLGDAIAFSNLGCALRLYTNGRFEARNGSDYAAVNNVLYQPGQEYDVVLTVNLSTKTYSATVNGVQIASNYSFRTEQIGVTGFDRFAVTKVSGDFTVKRLSNVSLPKQGRFPLAGLIRGSDGDFYGCASEGGDSGHGTVFRMTPSGVISKLADFSGNGATNKGSRPVAELVERNGMFYGTTSAGGAQDKGTLFRVSPAGVLETLFDFESDQQDSRPLSALVSGPDGNLYGTSSGDSDTDGGGVFRLVFDGPPAIYPMAAELVANNEALLRGKFNARGKTTRVDLEYGTNGSTFPSVVTLTTSLSGYQSAELGTSLPGLIRGITYYYRFRAKNSINEETVSSIQTFDTIGPPTAVVTDATQIKKLTATLNGTVRAGNATTFVTFEYGVDGNSFPNSVSASPVNGSNEVAVSESVSVTGGTTYYFRISATNSAGTTVSGVRTFTTLTEPTAEIGLAKSLSTTSARLTGTVNPHGTGTDVVFEYWTGSSIPAIPPSLPAATPHLDGIDNQQVSAVLTNLQQGIVYHFRVRATSAAGTIWSPEGTFSPDLLSGFTQDFPGPPETSYGVVIVTLTPSGIGGGWRFAGEQTWRASGFPATGLTDGDRLIEFRPVNGKVTPPAEPVTVISGGAAVFLSRNYEDSGQPGSGSITVTLKPDSLVTPSRAGWRLSKPGGNTDPWLASGDTLDNLQAGTYLIEFKPIVAATGEPQFATPRPTQVIVDDGTSSNVTTIYFLKDAQSGQPPELVPFETASTSQQLPYAYLGQIRSDGGSSSGFVVKPVAGGATVVATAGHVVFDDVTLSLVTNLQWLFQRDSASHEPKPLIPRGAHLLDDYAAARSGAVPGQGTSQSQNRDAAALFFNTDPGRGGNAGFLASDSAENEFLKSDSLKTLVGYPVDGDEFTAGRLYATSPLDVHFSRVVATDEFGAPFRTYTTPDIRGAGGMSGGPLCVRFETGSYYPAAIYLGGSNQATVVRAIDSKVIEIFNRAVVSSTAGDNNTGGGITLTSSTTLTGNSPGQGALRVVLKPEAVRAMGAGWRVGSSGSFRTSGQSQAADAGVQPLQLLPVSGYKVPAENLTVTIVEGKQRDIIFEYTDINDPPTLSNVGNRTIDEDSATAAIPITVSDVDDSENSLTLSAASSSNTTLVPKANIVFGGSGSNRSVTVTPAANQSGSATITLTVSDGDLSANDSFILTVTPVNDAPTITAIANQTLASGTSPTPLAFTIADVDTSVTSLTLAAASTNPTLTPLGNIAFGGSGANRNVTVTPAPGQLGSALITVTVSDGGLTASHAFTLTVTGNARETWRFARFGTANNTGSAADSADPDGDGGSNLDEYAAGTDPLNAADVFKILTSVKNATTFTVTAAGKAGRSYVLERRTSLGTGPWTTVTSIGPLASDGPITLTDPAPPGNSAFYRLRVSAP